MEQQTDVFHSLQSINIFFKVSYLLFKFKFKIEVKFIKKLLFYGNKAKESADLKETKRKEWD